MFGRCCGIAGIVLTALMAATGTVAAQGLFDFLFKPPQISMPRPAEGPAEGSRASGSGRYATYCVRLCDGRYFPVQRTGTAQPGEICSSLCPASKTKIFAGSDISYATAGDGTRYTSLPNAFVYREKVVESCTCNGTNAFGLAKVALADDPTLRKGDMIATKDGIEKYDGPITAHARSGHPGEADSPTTGQGTIDTAAATSRERERRHRRPTFSFFGLRF